MSKLVGFIPVDATSVVGVGALFFVASTAKLVISKIDAMIIDVNFFIQFSFFIKQSQRMIVIKIV